MTIQNDGKRITIAGLILNILLALGKILAGVVFSSQTILADGLHSGSDLVTDLAVLFGIEAAQKPADHDHHYGHYRIQSLVALFVGGTLLLAAGWIAYHALATLQTPSVQEPSVIPLTIALISVLVKEILFRLTMHVGRRNHDLSLLANAWHHRSDAFSSVAAAAGLAGVYFGGKEWAFLDQVTAVVLAAFLCVAAVKIIWSATSEILDRAPDAHTQESLARIISTTRGVKDHHAFRARQIGGNVIMDIHILVDPGLTVNEGHEIATEVERRLLESDRNVMEAIVHIEPWTREQIIRKSD